MLVSGQATALDAFFDRVDYPFYVVTVRDTDEQMGGCLAGFVTQCSIDPPQFIVCISKINHTMRVATRSAAMAIHLLGDDQIDMARLFGEETGDSTDKFSRCDWRRGTSGAPLLVESAAALEGAILGHFSVGDHEAFVFRATRSVAGTHDGLLTYRNAPPIEAGHPA